MKYLKLKFILFFLPVVFSACGGGASAQSTPQSTADIFHGIKVPPDPGSAADATVAGVDTDGNGIRDDVDRTLAKIYGADAKKYAAAQISARSSQKILLVDASDAAAATAAVFSNFDTAACLSDKLDSDFSATSEIIDRNILLSYNTVTRRTQVRKVHHSVGQFTRGMGDVSCK